MRIAIAEFLFRVVAGKPSSAFEGNQRVVRWPLIASIFALVTLAIIALILWAFWTQTIGATQAAYLVLLSTLFTLSFVLFIRSMELENRLAVESNWGGLGGGLGGWRISSSVTFLITTVAVFALLVSAIGATRIQTDLRERYRAAISLGEREGIRFDSFQTVGQKLVLRGSAPSVTPYNHLWDQVKLVNPFYDDIDVAVSVPPAKSAPIAETKQPEGKTQSTEVRPAGKKSPESTATSTVSSAPK